MALRPTCRMGPPLRSSAADAHYCIMVQIPWDRPNTSMWRDAQRPIGELPSDRPRKHRCAEQVPEWFKLAIDRKHPIQIVGHRTAPAGLDRQAGLGAVERLDLGFF